ncbi:MAG: Rab family GTPase [Candidatus Saliniplasma sp.]
MAKYTAKILVLGDGAVGKTSLVRRYIKGEFEEDYIATIGVNLKHKTLDDIGLDMSIWDLYGQKSMSPGKHSSNYIGAEGALIVFDLTRKKTLENIRQWVDDLYEVIGKVPIVFAGNKRDILIEFQKKKNLKLTKKTKEEFHDFMIDEYYYKSIYSQEPKFVPVSSSEVKGMFKSFKKTYNKKTAYYLTSAKTGKNVEEAFKKLGEFVMENQIRYEV